VEGLKGTGFTGFRGFEDIFSSFGDIFEDFFGFGRTGRRATRSRPGADLRYDLKITFEESALGKTTEIELPKTVQCESCRGTGARVGTYPSVCPACRGTGQVTRSQGFFSISTTCPQCGGEGKINAHPCRECNGHGKVRQSRKIEISIPPGVGPGSKMRVRGEGEQGERGGPPGDLYVFIHVESHDFFSREGDDVICQIPISFPQAALGAELEVPTLSGKRTVSVPKGIESGEFLRIRSEGFARLRGHGKGDQIVQVLVKTPKDLSKRQEELLREFEELGRKKEKVGDFFRGFLKREGKS
jgi:molecular chaperone DnaJ